MYTCLSLSRKIDNADSDNGTKRARFIGKWKLLFRGKMTGGFFFRNLAFGRCVQLSDDTNDHSLLFPIEGNFNLFGDSRRKKEREREREEFVR